ncbi:uncharacterized protein G2W53_025103 [Senna tora]|uniref:Uncharacterized protein n=1 Tax=Senna tora TaxID=362788 RepID=A0A834WG50_9FABA|nr:uncharacterized protein G2W53_025103 [Senna tora]
MMSHLLQQIVQSPELHLHFHLYHRYHLVPYLPPPHALLGSIRHLQTHYLRHLHQHSIGQRSWSSNVAWLLKCQDEELKAVYFQQQWPEEHHPVSAASLSFL